MIPNPLPRLRRVLPGIAWKDQFDRLVTAKGIIISVSPTKVWVETDSKIIGNPTGGAKGKVCLLGDTYIYICDRCPSTVYHQEVEGMRQAEIDAIEALPVQERAGKQVRPARCPFCSGPIRYSKEGERLILHYRFASDGSSGTWWAERKDW